MKNHRHQLQRILVMFMSVAMVFTMSACRNSDEDEMQQYMEEYNAKLAEYQDFGTWKQQIQSEPAGDDYKVYTIIGIQDAMKDYIGDSIQELFNDIQVESLAYDGRITYVGVDDGVDKNLEIVDIIMRAAGFDLETEINAENGVVVEPRTRNWKATENSNYDDWVAKASKNLNTLLFQQVVVCPQNMTQVSGDSEGVTVSNNVITLDFMSMKKDETFQFAPLLSWSVDVEYGGTQEAWQKLGLTVPSDAETLQYADKNMLVTHASYSANTVQNDLKLHDVVKMADSNALNFLPSEQWLQGTIGYADGGVCVTLNSIRNTDVQGLDESSLLWFSDDIYMKLTWNMPYTVKQGEGATAGNSINGNALTVVLGDLTENLEHRWVGTLGEVENNVKTSVSFRDVTPDAWYYDAVIATGNAGLISGTGDGAFNPDGQLTVAECFTIIAQAAGLDYKDKNKGDDYWAYGALQASLENGYLFLEDGESVGQALGQSLCTRQRAIYALYEATDIPTFTDPDGILPDGMQVDERYLAGVVSAYAAGIVSGKDESGTMEPDSPITRAQFCQMLYNAGLV